MPGNLKWPQDIIVHPNGKRYAWNTQVYPGAVPSTPNNPDGKVLTKILTIPVEVLAGQSVLVEGDGVARIYDAKGSQIRSVPLTGMLPKVQPGKNAVRFDCAFNGPTPPKVVVTVKTLSAPTRVQRTK